MPELPQTVCAHDAGSVSGAPYREKQENAVPVLRAERVSPEDADEVKGGSLHLFEPFAVGRCKIKIE